MLVFGPFCALMSSFTWALGSAEYARLSRSHSAFAVNLARSLFALPLFIIAALVLSAVSGGSLGAAFVDFHALEPKHVVWLAVSMVSSYAVGDALFLWSTRRLGVPAALSIASTYPLLTAGWGVLYHGESLSSLRLAGLVITVLGVCAVILSMPRPTRDASTEQRTAGYLAMGIAVAFLTSIFWALNTYAVSEAGKGISPAVGNSVRMIIACLLCFGLGRIFQPKMAATVPFRDLRGVAWVFILEAFGGSLFFMYGLAHSPLALGSALASVAPAISVPIAWMLGLERFSWLRTVSVCVVVLGLWLLVTG